ncbi:MAG: aspartate/glutamate racemase family protein [Reyranellaceae bacterium]
MPRIGMLTPSSNTVLEPVTSAMLREHPAITAHFSRFKVTEIALSDAATGQFAYQPILSAAELLADARCDLIAWNGTSASWLGFDRDEELVRRIEQATKIRAATCVLGYRRLIRQLGLGRIGLVSPYTSDVQAQIVDTWRAAGLHIAAETHLGLRDNFSFATVTEDWIDAALGRMAEAGCDGAVILCTNMRGALPAARREATLGIPILDSVAVTLWSALDALGLDKRAFTQWGRWFTA